jgi:hypothetical protein
MTTETEGYSVERKHSQIIVWIGSDQRYMLDLAQCCKGAPQSQIHTKDMTN